MFLLFEIATETVGTQHLQRTEEYKQGESVHEMTGRRHLDIVLQRVIVFVDQFTAQLMRILRRSLPEERGQVIIVGTLTTTLIVNKVWIAVVVEHDITGLEVTIEEGIGRLCRQVFGKEPEVGFEFQLVKIKLGGFQETVLEIIQVEEHTVLIELRLWITVREVKFTGATDLDVRQLTDGTLQQLLFLQGIAPSCLPSTFNGIEERE